MLLPGDVLDHVELGNDIALADVLALDLALLQQAVDRLGADAAQHFTELLGVHHVRVVWKHNAVQILQFGFLQ